MALGTSRNRKPYKEGEKHDQSKNRVHRVSLLDQNSDRQLKEIHLDKVFTDKASGKDTNRPTPGRSQLRSSRRYTRGPFHGQAGAKCGGHAQASQGMNDGVYRSNSLKRI